VKSLFPIRFNHCTSVTQTGLSLHSKLPHEVHATHGNVFIDMHSAIDVLNFKYRNVANTRGTRKYAVWQCFESSVIFRGGMRLMLHMYFNVAVHILYICLIYRFRLSFIVLYSLVFCILFLP